MASLPHVYVGGPSTPLARESVRLEEIETYPIVVCLSRKAGWEWIFSREIASSWTLAHWPDHLHPTASTFYNVVENTDAFSIGGSGIPAPVGSAATGWFLSLSQGAGRHETGVDCLIRTSRSTREMTAFPTMTEALNDALSPVGGDAPEKPSTVGGGVVSWGCRNKGTSPLWSPRQNYTIWIFLIHFYYLD